MTENENIEGNRLIADFMGWNHHEDSAYDKHEMENLKYYSSWVGDFKLIYKFLTRNNLTEFWLEGNGSYDEYGETDLTDICKYVHQLQNLYFSLTDVELEIKKIPT